jgi:hypothetical protein
LLLSAANKMEVTGYSKTLATKLQGVTSQKTVTANINFNLRKNKQIKENQHFNSS